MEKKLTKHKVLRRKYKHYAAALAGVAIMAGTSLHGIPFAKATAAENPSMSPPITTEQTAPIDKKLKKLPIDADTDATDPATASDQDSNANNTITTPDRHDNNKDDRHENRDRIDKREHRDDRGDRSDRDDHYRHERYEHERWADRQQAFEQRIAWYNDSANKIQIYNDNANPVDIVTAAAADLGFDAATDTFNLLSQSDTQSIVRVVHNGNNYDITVDHLSNGSWQLSLVNPSS